VIRRIGSGLLWGFVAYLIGAFGGGFLITLLSSNQHDKSLEAAMTGAFVLGPIAAIVGFITGMMKAKPRSA
jgi:uncharacterized membrane protein YeaQ/YmgE (transglycosylase-associated protein family)